MERRTGPGILPGGGLLAGSLRAAIAREIRSVFNDRARGESPVVRRDDGLFGPGSVAWRVHGDVTSMVVGGVAALLLQMLHPAVLAGVWDHSDFRTDMLGRFRRTARFIALTTYGSRTEAEEAIARVRGIHERLGGTLPDGQSYRADDPELLAWVHVAEATSFLGAWMRYGSTTLTSAEQDRYFREMAVLARALGADPLPENRQQAAALIARMRPRLKADARTREVAHLLLNQPAPRRSTEPLQALTFQAAVDLLPDWARRMHHLRGSGVGRPLIHIGTLGIAQTIRWAFR